LVWVGEQWTGIWKRGYGRKGGGSGNI